MSVETKKQIEDNEYRWYVLSVVSSQESLVIENIQERVKKQDLGNDIVDYMIPTVNEVVYKNDKKIFRAKKLYPGYVFIKSKMNEKIWYIIRNTPGVRLIVGAETRPIPLTQREYDDIVKQVQERNERAEFAVPFQEGDVVILRDWDFNGMKGVITEIDLVKGFLYVNVEILWRNTPVMVSFEKVERA
jgi:transcriptional antiterminator NusG